MFKNLLIVVILCYCGEYALARNIRDTLKHLSQDDTTRNLLQLPRNFNFTQNFSDIPDEVERKPMINNIHGHNIYHYYVGQIIYTYDEKELKQLLDRKCDNDVINASDKTNNDINNTFDKNNIDNKYSELELEGYRVIPKIGAYKPYFKPLSWNDARQTCIQEGGNLAIINLESKKDLFVKMLEENKFDTVWLGVHDLFKEGEWVTVNGDPFVTTEYIKWAQDGVNGWMSGDQPNNLYGKQNCMELVKEGMLNDQDCNMWNGFFCEISV